MESGWRRRSDDDGRRHDDELQNDQTVRAHQHDVDPVHELSIALRIIEIAEDEARRNGSRKIDAVHLRLGALSGVAREALLFSYRLACEGTVAEGSRLLFEEGAATDLEVVGLEVE